MPAFSHRYRSWWIARAFGRNPLLRWTDRTEACVIVFAILVVLAATPVCAAAGMGVYTSHARLYAEQSRARHAVTATVVETGPRPHQPHSTPVSTSVSGSMALGLRSHRRHRRRRPGWTRSASAHEYGLLRCWV